MEWFTKLRNGTDGWLSMTKDQCSFVFIFVSVWLQRTNVELIPMSWNLGESIVGEMGNRCLGRHEALLWLSDKRPAALFLFVLLGPHVGCSIEWWSIATQPVGANSSVLFSLTQNWKNQKYCSYLFCVLTTVKKEGKKSWGTENLLVLSSVSCYQRLC